VSEEQCLKLKEIDHVGLKKAAQFINERELKQKELSMVA